MEEKNIVRKRHSVILEDRKQLSLSGVSDVSGFDEETVVLETRTAYRKGKQSAYQQIQP